MRVGCTTDTNKHDNAKRVVGVVEPQHKIYSATDSPHGMSWKKSRQQLTCVCVIKQAEDCKGESSGIYPLSSEWVASSDRDSGTRRPYGETVGCFRLSLHKGQPQTAHQLPSRVRMLPIPYCFHIIKESFIQSKQKNLLSCG